MWTKLLNLRTIGALVVIAFLSWTFSINYNLSKANKKLAQNKTEIQSLKAAVDSVKNVTYRLHLKNQKDSIEAHDARVQDSTLNAKLIGGLQRLTVNYRVQIDTCNKQNERLASGLYEWKVNVFGKKRLVRKGE